jgi:hypothetical protein
VTQRRSLGKKREENEYQNEYQFGLWNVRGHKPATSGPLAIHGIGVLKTKMKARMKARFRLVKYNHRGGIYYSVDRVTGARESLETKDKERAQELLSAKNESSREATFNLQKARIYLNASDPAVRTRTWQNALDAAIASKEEGSENRHRWETAAKDTALDNLRKLVVVQTQPQDLLDAIEDGAVSTNVFLRRLHNFYIGMNWLPWPVMVKRQWPKIQFKDKRAITWEEHQAIIARELNPERKAFYHLAWHLNASQSDLACLEAENIDWEHNVISFARKKTGSIVIMRFDEDMAEILRDLPGSGPLFPYLRTVRAGDRATEFHQRCAGLGIKGVSLHSYRYAWAEPREKGGLPGTVRAGGAGP